MFSNHILVPSFLLLTLILPLNTKAASVKAEAPEQSTSSVISKGMKIELTLEPDQPGNPVREGEYANLRLRLKDTVTDSPITALSPAVWIDLRKPYELKKGKAVTCEDKVRAFLQGALSYRPDIDLNSYFILTLNNDASISVIDPILGVSGYSQLYTMILLKKPGEDWAFSHDEKKLAVTMPKAGEVAVVDTTTFKVMQTVPAGALPGRILLQPDRRYFWVGNNAADSSGVTALDAARFEKAGFIPTGPGSHDIAVSDDSRHLYVTNTGNATLSIVETGSLRKIRDIILPSKPTAVAWSALAKAAYVATEGGEVVVIDGGSHAITKTITFPSRLRTIKFAPGDRWGFALGSADDSVHVIDASANAVIHTGKTGKEPYQIAFSPDFAYVRCRLTADMTLIPLADLGKADKLNIFTVSGGQRAPGETEHLPSPADLTVNAPEVGGILFASPADSSIIYYMEGMQVPMGSFNTYGRKPRGLAVVNRRLRETEPGVYTAKVRIPKKGSYDVGIFIDAPRMVQCMEFAAEGNPVFSKLAAERPVSLEVAEAKNMVAGKEFALRFRVKDLDGQPVSELKDVVVLPSLSPVGAWQESHVARSLGKGEYETVFTPPRAGTYNVYFSIPSLQVKISQIQPLSLKAE